MLTPGCVSPRLQEPNEKAVFKTESSGFESCSPTPSCEDFSYQIFWASVSAVKWRWTSTHFLGSLSGKKKNLCKARGTILGTSWHWINMACWLWVYCMEHLNSENKPMNICTFQWMLEHFWWPFSVCFSKYGSEIRFYSVHHLKNGKCLVVKPSHKSWGSHLVKQIEKESPIRLAFLPYFFSPLFFYFWLGKQEKPPRTRNFPLLLPGGECE